METLPLEIGETAHALRKSFDRRASALGATRAQWKVLFKLSRKPGLRQVELADILDVEPITLCRIVDRLEEAGLIQRVRDPADRRAWRLEVTQKAEPLIAKLRALAEEMTTQAFAGLEPRQLESMRAQLAKIRDNISAAAPINKAVNQ